MNRSDLNELAASIAAKEAAINGKTADIATRKALLYERALLDREIAARNAAQQQQVLEARQGRLDALKSQAADPAVSEKLAPVARVEVVK